MAEAKTSKKNKTAQTAASGFQKNIRGRTPEGAPNPVDKHVGNRIRLRRTILGYSQQFMARKLGLTFQQVQKYEKGCNRVGASRLWDISKVLEVPMEYFFEDMDAGIAGSSPMMSTMPDDVKDLMLQKLSKEKEVNEDDPMCRQETLELVRAYYKIRNRQLAQTISEMLKIMSRSNSLFPDEAPDAADNPCSKQVPEELYRRINDILNHASSLNDIRNEIRRLLSGENS